MLSPRVSVIIPTFKRSDLVLRSVQSALQQTFSEIEVLVVIDGQDPATRKVLSQVKDSRLRTFELQENRGAPHARNQGVINSKSKWIAFLDDDDEWYPKKLEKQILKTNQIKTGYPVIACQLQVKTGGGTYLLPRRIPREAEVISDYLFVRNSLFRGEGSIATSMILTDKELLLKYPFEEKLKRHQEADWLIRVSAYEKIALRFVNEPLGILHIESERPRISESGNWKYSFNWVKSRRTILTPRAYSAFLLTSVSAVAAREKNWSAFMAIFIEAISSGQPSIMQYGLFLGTWLVPQPLRRFLRVKWLSHKTVKT